MMDFDSILFSQHPFDNFFYIFKHKYSVSYNICIILVVFFCSLFFLLTLTTHSFSLHLFSDFFFILLWAHVHWIFKIYLFLTQDLLENRVQIALFQIAFVSLLAWEHSLAQDTLSTNGFCSWILSPRVRDVDLCLGILRGDFFFFPLSFPRQSQTLISLSITKEKFYFISTSGALCACFWRELYFLVSGYGLLKIQFIGHQVILNISMADAEFNPHLLLHFLLISDL